MSRLPMDNSLVMNTGETRRGAFCAVGSGNVSGLRWV
jgi:hypothetical protein